MLPLHHIRVPFFQTPFQNGDGTCERNSIYIENPESIRKYNRNYFKYYEILLGIKQTPECPLLLLLYEGYAGNCPLSNASPHRY